MYRLPTVLSVEVRGRAGTRSDLSAILWDQSCRPFIVCRRGMAVSSHCIPASAHFTVAWFNLLSSFRAHPVRSQPWCVCKKVHVNVLPRPSLQLSGSSLHPTVAVTLQCLITGQVITVPH